MIGGIHDCTGIVFRHARVHPCVCSSCGSGRCVVQLCHWLLCCSSNTHATTASRCTTQLHTCCLRTAGRRCRTPRCELVTAWCIAGSVESGCAAANTLLWRLGWHGFITGPVGGLRDGRVQVCPSGSLCTVAKGMQNSQGCVEQGQVCLPLESRVGRAKCACLSNAV